MDIPRIMTRQTAERLGISVSRQRHEVARGRWSSPAPGLIATFSSPLSRHDWVAAALCVAGERGTISGWDAAVLAGVPVGIPDRSRILVLTGHGRSRSVGPALIRRSDRPVSVSFVPFAHDEPSFVPVASVARSIADAATESSWDGPIMDLVTAALRERMVNPAQLESELGSGPRNGSGTLRRVLADLGTSHSVAEVAAARALRRRRVVGFEQNVDVHDAEGHVVARVDFLWRSLRAVVEIDSWQHHGSHRGWLATMQRHARLTGLGYAVVHVAPATLSADPVGWADGIATWLADRALEVGGLRRPA